MPLAAKRAIRNLCRRRGARRPRRAIHLPGWPPGARLRGRGPTRPGHRFCCQKRWENHQGLRFLRWLRVDFHRRRPRRLRPWTRGPWRRWVVTGWQEPGVHCRPPHWLALAVTGAPAEAQRSTRKGHAASVRRQSRQRLRSGFGGESFPAKRRRWRIKRAGEKERRDWRATSARESQCRDGSKGPAEGMSFRACPKANDP